MEKAIVLRIFLFLLFILVVDIYAFKGIYLLFNPVMGNRLRIVIYAGYWLLSACCIAVLLLSFTSSPGTRDVKLYTNFFYLGTLILMVYLPKILFLGFHLLEDLSTLIIQLIRTIYHHLLHHSNEGIGLSRMFFLSYTGLAAGVLIICILGYGMLGRFNFKVWRVEICHPSVPAAFNGFKIVQLSDLHLGSFVYHREQVERLFTIVNNEHPDAIFFTGDLVNEFAEELEGYDQTFLQLTARYGKFAILGNHDYGDYYKWKDSTDKKRNLHSIQQFLQRTGFNLLLNRCSLINHDSSVMAVIGVENWGEPPFKQYGNLKEAMGSCADIPFKVLLSHDPSHWSAEVFSHPDIFLTLSGHTHGMQFGIEIGQWKWSPVQYKYPQWAGLYRCADQYLYVNRGAGYIGYAGRVGIRPEVTVITLSSKKE